MKFNEMVDDWSKITEVELEEVRDEYLDEGDLSDDVVEKVLEFSAEDVRDAASRSISDGYRKSRHCDNCGFDWRVKGEFMHRCLVCGSSVQR